LTEQTQGGTQPPAEATADAAETDETVGTVAVADEPATSPSLDTEAAGSIDDATEATDTTDDATSAASDAPEAADAAAAIDEAAETPAPETAAPADAQVDEPAYAPPAAESDPVEAEAPAAAAQTEAPANAAPAETEAPAATAETETTPASAEADAPPAAAEAPAPTVPSGPEPTTMEELLAEQDADIKSFKHGDVVEGNVVRIDKDEILVDIGAKSEGVVSNRELFGRNTEAQPALNVGDTVLVYVLQPESPEGHVVLSLRRAGLERKWRSMQEQFEAGVIIEAPVIDHNKGGLIVDCGIRGFVPISQIVDFPRRPQNDQPRDAAQEIAEKLQPFVGRKLRLKILEVNQSADPVREGRAVRGAPREAG
jgi:DNA-directed RNA polymerase subunit E'/Rpb7